MWTLTCHLGLKAIHQTDKQTIILIKLRSYKPSDFDKNQKQKWNFGKYRHKTLCYETQLTERTLKTNCVTVRGCNPVLSGL